MKKLIDKDGEIHTKKDDILKEIRDFYKKLFTKNKTEPESACMQFLNELNMPKLSNQDRDSCDEELTIEDLKESLLSMEGGRSPGNDGLTKEWYVFFWDAIKEPLFESLIEAKSKNSLSTSQRQALIKLLEKKDRDKRYIENWRPISLLNLDTKILTKALANKIKPVLSSIIKSDQTAYVNGRFIGESHRLISDILETTHKLKLDRFILTIDI